MRYTLLMEMEREKPCFKDKLIFHNQEPLCLPSSRDIRQALRAALLPSLSKDKVPLAPYLREKVVDGTQHSSLQRNPCHNSSLHLHLSRHFFIILMNVRGVIDF